LVDTGVLTLPKSIQSDEYLGTKNFEARTMFSIIDADTPKDTIVQFNPLVGLNRPTGLYRTRSAFISYHTLYGVSPDIYRPLARKISKLFLSENANWHFLDSACKVDKINIIIISDLDEAWAKVPNLEKEREPLYKGKHYSAFYCGN